MINGDKVWAKAGSRWYKGKILEKPRGFFLVKTKFGVTSYSEYEICKRTTLRDKIKNVIKK